MQTLKHAEQFVGVPFVEAGAIITDEDHRRALLLNLPHLDASNFAPLCIFDGIRKQIYEYLFHQTRIAIHRGQISN